MCPEPTPTRAREGRLREQVTHSSIDAWRLAPLEFPRKFQEARHLQLGPSSVLHGTSFNDVAATFRWPIFDSKSTHTVSVTAAPPWEDGGHKDTTQIVVPGTWTRDPGMFMASLPLATSAGLCRLTDRLPLRARGDESAMKQLRDYAKRRRRRVSLKGPGRNADPHLAGASPPSYGPQSTLVLDGSQSWNFGMRSGFAIPERYGSDTSGANRRTCTTQFGKFCPQPVEVEAELALPQFFARLFFLGRRSSPDARPAAASRDTRRPRRRPRR